MRKIALFTIAFCLFLTNMFAQSFDNSIHELATKLQPISETSETKSSVAVLRFSTENNAYAFERYFSDILFECLFSNSKVRLVERADIDKILNEQSFQISGNVSDETAKSIGKIIGVDYVCFGTITNLGKYLKISGRTVDVQSGSIDAIGSVQIEINEDIKNLLNPSYKGNISLQSKGYTSIQTNNWKFKTYRNDFDNTTIITLTCSGSGFEYLLLGYEKNDNQLKSKITIGIVSTDCGGNASVGRSYDVKEDNSNISKITLWGRTWSETNGLKKGNQNIPFFAESSNQRFFFDLLINNKLLIFRDGDSVIKFNVNDLSTILSQNGITYAEISDVLANDEF